MKRGDLIELNLGPLRILLRFDPLVRRPVWRRHEPPGFLVGYIHIPGWFILHLGPGYLEWGHWDP